MNLIIIISICIFFSYLIKKYWGNLNLNSSFKSYIDALAKIGDKPDNILDLKYSLNKLSKKGCILILKIGLLSIPYFIIFLLINLTQINNIIKFFIPLSPYFILFLND